MKTGSIIASLTHVYIVMTTLEQYLAQYQSDLDEDAARNLKSYLYLLTNEIKRTLEELEKD